MSRRVLPKPTQRKGSLTWEIRTRLGDKIVTRSLRSRDYDIALSRVPAVYEDLLREHKAQPAALPPAVVADAASPNRLTVAEACASYRAHLLACERQFRTEHAQAGVADAIDLAATYSKRINEALRRARAKAIVHDFDHQRWWLTYLSKKGIGEVEDQDQALLALARAKIAAYREILENDRLLEADVVEQPKALAAISPPTPPALSVVLEEYIKERGPAMTDQFAADHRAIVRDLISLVGDRAVDSFGREDARILKDALLSLPANWTKRRELRGLSLADAVIKAKALRLPRQAAKTIKMKRSMLRGVFNYAAANYDHVKNPFEGDAWVVADEAASDQRDAFTKAELKLLLSSDLRGHLYWLTWLGLCTGARLNELCQLTSAHVFKEPLPRIYFSPNLKLKTGRLKSNASIRSVPLHPKLVELGFLDYVASCQKNEGGRLFPGLPQHRSGRLSDAPSKAFRRHLTVLGIKRASLSYHSLRHAFSAEFKRTAPTDIETRERLMGHAVSGVAGRYGNSYEAEANDIDLLKMRAAILKRLDFNF